MGEVGPKRESVEQSPKGRAKSPARLLRKVVDEKKRIRAFFE